jgi:hypothetical protein
LYNEAERQVRDKVLDEAATPDQTVFPDEDEVLFTRQELRALRDSFRKTAKELSVLKNRLARANGEKIR